MSICSPPSCSSSWRQGFAVSSPRHLQEVLTSSGRKKYLREKFSDPTSNGNKRREKERERERGCGEACVRVCLAERKCQLSHEHPTSLPGGQQLLEPPVILATNCVEDKDVTHTYYVEGKKMPYFLYIATITELRKYTVGGIVTQKSPSCSLLLEKTHPF